MKNEREKSNKQLGWQLGQEEILLECEGWCQVKEVAPVEYPAKAPHRELYLTKNLKVTEHLALCTQGYPRKGRHSICSR